MKKSKTLDLKYAGTQVFFFAAFAAVLGYASNFLLAKGFNSGTIGIALSVASVVAVFGQPIIGSFADSHPQIELRKIVSLAILIAIILSVGIFIFNLKGMTLLIIMVVLFSVLQIVMPLMNSMAFIFEKYGFEINYGLARGLGSVAYAFAALGIGYIVDDAGPSILPLFYIIFTVLALITVYTFKLPKGSHKNETVEEETEDQSEQLSFGNFCVKYKKLIAFLLGFVFIYFTHTIINNFFIQILSNIGGTSADQGTAVFLAAMLELPTMAYFNKLNEKFDCATLIKFAIVMFLVKHALTYFAVNMFMIYAAQVCQMFAYALITPAAVYYVNEKVDQYDRNKGQSVLAMSMVLAGIFANLVGGIMLDELGVSTVLLIGVITTVVGVVIMFATVEKSQ